MMRILPLGRLALVGVSLFLLRPSWIAAQGPAPKTGDASSADPMDWPNWRGPELNGVSREKGLVEKWSPRGKGQNVLWKRTDLGGRSTPICMRGKLYTILRDNPDSEIEGERVVCLDAATGKTIWENEFNVFLSDVPPPRVGWSSVVGDPETGNVFAVGVCGLFQCIDGHSGKTLWSHSLSEEHGIISAFGGRTALPVISGNLVFVSSVFVDWGTKAQPAQRILAFDKRNGQTVWYGDTRPRPEDVSYAMPVPTVLNGQAVLVVSSGDGSVYGFQTRTGKQLWSYHASHRGIQATPLVVDGHVFVGQEEENRDDRSMGAFFGIDASKHGDLTKAGELFRDKELAIGKCAAIPVDGKVAVVATNGYLYIVDPKNGELVGDKKKLDSADAASPVSADGKIYICTLSGIWHTLKLGTEGVNEIYRLRLSTPEDGETNASPIVSHGRIYQQQPNALYCIAQPGREPQADPRPEPPKEAATDTDLTPGLLQLAPCDSLLAPGMKQRFQARLYNSRGQFLREAKPTEVKFSLTGPGQISPDGKFTAAATGPAAGVLVKAEVGSLKDAAQLRVIPDLPWKFDFNDGQIPVTWIGARSRHVPLDYAVYAKLKQKSAEAARLYIYLSTNFTNSGRPALKLDDNTPQELWSTLLRYLNLVEAASHPDDAKKVFDPLLKMLADEKVISKWGWPNKKGIELTVERGPRKIGKDGVMLKIVTIPRGARSQTWFGQTDLHDYTIQSDVSGAVKNNRMPDIGVIGQRYTLMLMGDSQKIEIRSWPAHPIRMRKEIPFPWKGDTWYTMKFRAGSENGHVVLRGKVWPRDQKEPAAWSLEMTDPSPRPNLEGSPGVAGDAQQAEIFYDNILVTKNESAAGAAHSAASQGSTGSRRLETQARSSR